MAKNNRIKKIFFLILITALLFNCKNAVEKSKENFEPLVTRMKEKGFLGVYLNEKPDLFQYLI